MPAKGVYITWRKGQKVQISEWFQTDEFRCPCKYPECSEQKIALELVRRLDWVRKAVNSPIRIHSGFRCRAHQHDLQKQALAGKGQLTVVAAVSTHEAGDAADFSCSALTIAELKPIVEKKFMALGAALSFLHVDLRDDKIRRWKY